MNGSAANPYAGGARWLANVPGQGLSATAARGRVSGRPKVVFNRAKFEGMHSTGMSPQKIAAKVGVSRSSVHRAVQELNGGK